jgi:methanogenic corrinoid protein MtbC1
MHGATAGHSSSNSHHGGNGEAAAAGPRARERLRLLAEAIESEIVPRLLAGHQPAVGQQDNTAAAPHSPPHNKDMARAFAPISQDAVTLARLVLDSDTTAARMFITGAVARLGLEPACLTLLAPAARHLGDLWDEDICSFSDVTIGLMRLQSALLAESVPDHCHPDRLPGAAPRRTALLAPAPGDQHTFGLTMVAGFLERAGWAVTQLHDGSPDTLEAVLRASWFGVLGLSAGSSVKLDILPRILPRLRAMSRNPDLGVMVGGPLFVARPGLAAEIGADGTAIDGAHAVIAAEALIARHRAHRDATG